MVHNAHTHAHTHTHSHTHFHVIHVSTAPNCCIHTSGSGGGPPWVAGDVLEGQRGLHHKGEHSSL